MSLAPDLPRLRATLGDPRLARLLAALHRRIELGEPLAGMLTLTRATPDERAAADELLGRRPTRGHTLRLDLDRLAAMLRDAALCADLRAGVEALLGPIADRRAAAHEHEAAWTDAWRAVDDASAARPELQSWLATLARLGIVRRLCGNDPSAGSVLLRELARVAVALPVQAEPLPAFAARLFGDAHALDPGTPRATLAVRAAARLGRIQFEDDAEGRRAAWASVGVMCDELSTPALAYNLSSREDTPLGRLLRAAANDAEPIHLSLHLLLRWRLGPDSGLAGKRIFVCENPTVVALAAKRLGSRCPPLACVNGQFATPSLVLLRQLRETGAELWYHGDFDPAGLQIARRAMAESGARPWRFGAADYLAAPKGVALVGAVPATPWDLALGETMRRERRVVHEETVFEALAEDLARPDLRPG